MYYFSLVCTSKKAINNFQSKCIMYKKGILKFRGKFDNRCDKFIQFTVSSITVIW